MPMPWEIVTNYSEILAIPAALLPTNQILMFGGSEHNADQNRSGNPADLDNTRPFNLAGNVCLDAGLVLNKRYRILDFLRGGGFGNAYLAEDQNKPSRPRCVVKHLTYRHDDETVYQQAAERFFREAAVIESLGKQSDQIPSLFAYFEENDQLYIVQEWIDGDPFDTFLTPERRLDEGRVRDLLVSLLAVLDLVHSKGFIHRDIKPSNIILRRTDNQPVLIDFGVVKELLKGGVARGTEGISETIIVRSSGFSAPEQEAGHPVFASDIFSLGMTAISLLSTKGPASLQDPVSGTLPWREHAPDITPYLATILEKSIVPSHTQRFQTAREMLKALLDRPPPPPPSPPPPTADSTAFIEAISQGNIGTVQDFLEKGADVNAKDVRSGRAPLTPAVESGYFEKSEQSQQAELARIHGEAEIEYTRHQQEAAQLRGELERHRIELASAKAKVEAEQQQHAAERKRAAEEAHRVAERMTKAEADRATLENSRTVGELEALKNQVKEQIAIIKEMAGAGERKTKG